MENEAVGVISTASGSGDGSGYGYGYGSGDGDGYGYGSGYGDGYGSGSCDGSGYGYGYGYGSGDGDGYGYGSGSGDGSGYGDGDGSGYFEALVEGMLEDSKAAALKKEGAVLAIWKSKPDGSPANGGNGGCRKVGQIEEIPGPLKICTKNALHATLSPKSWKGEKMWGVALYPPVVGDREKYASLKREILCEIPFCV